MGGQSTYVVLKGNPHKSDLIDRTVDIMVVAANPICNMFAEFERTPGVWQHSYCCSVDTNSTCSYVGRATCFFTSGATKGLMLDVACGKLVLHPQGCAVCTIGRVDSSNST
jgi:hypothetical protein